MNRDELKEQKENEEWVLFVQGEGWQKAKAMLGHKVGLLNSVSTLDTDSKNADQILLEVNARQMVKEMIENLIADIEGIAEQHRFNSTQIIEEEIIIRHH